MIIKSIIKSLAAASCIVFTLSGCAPSLSPNTYDVYCAGQANPTEKGVIDSARIVRVSGSSPVGTIAGAALGAVAGSTIGQGSGSVLAAIGGGLLGAGAGNLVEHRLTEREGIEYIVRTCHGYVSVVQSPCPTFQRGQHVLVIYGERARIIADPAY